MICHFHHKRLVIVSIETEKRKPMQVFNRYDFRSGSFNEQYGPVGKVMEDSIPCSKIALNAGNYCYIIYMKACKIYRFSYPRYSHK